MTHGERSELIDALTEGGISEADFLRLEAELSIDPAARREYYDRLALSALLEVEATAEKQRASRIVPMPTPARRWTPAFAAAAAVLVAMLGMAVALLKTRNSPSAAATPSEKTASGFGVLTGQADAIWSNGATLLGGTFLPQGVMRLTSGVAQIELFSGVTVVVEGAAEFEIISPMEMKLSWGKIRARVPEAAHGFRIQTPEGQVVDLGTDFAVAAGAGHSEVHVIEGEVEWHPRADAMRRMREGEAVRWVADGRHTQLTARSDDFVGVSQLARKLEMSRQARREAWLRFNAALRSDPRLVLYYQMNAGEHWSRLVPNVAAGGGSLVGEAAVVAATRVADRWGLTAGALDFSPAGSRLRVNVPGEYGSLTLLCWARINSLDRVYNSLFLTDGHKLGAPHWQIMDDGRLFFSVKKFDRREPSRTGRDKYHFYSTPFWNASLSGQWFLLAVTYDVEARMVTHYVNGEAITRERVPEEYLVEAVKIGNASIGNWSQPAYRQDPQFAVRNLNGSVDEFAFFSAALSAREIKGIYDHGRP